MENIECVEGYTLYGSDTITCGNNFRYNNPLPKCLPSSGCTGPALDKGRYNTTETNLDEGTTLEVECEEGYSVYGDWVITCRGGSWSGLIPPLCRPEDDMEADCILPFLENGWLVPLADGPLNPGSTLVVQCNSGFGVAGGADRVLCVTRAYFEPALLPECTRLQVTGCEDLEVGPGYTDPDTGVRVGGTVQVTCYEGFQVSGPSLVLCGTDGQYNQLPYCEREPARLVYRLLNV